MVGKEPLSLLPKQLTFTVRNKRKMQEDKGCPYGKWTNEYIRHMADGTFVSWLAVDGEKIIGTSGMSFVETPPYFGCPSGRMGLLSSNFMQYKL